MLITGVQKAKQATSLAFSSRANYTDRATAACNRSVAPTFEDRGCCLVSTTHLYSRILGFVDRDYRRTREEILAYVSNMRIYGRLH
jgi:hypothetical protein